MRYLFFVLSFFVFFFVIGCSVNNSTNPVSLDAPGVYRSASVEGDNLVVTLHVVVPQDSWFYLFDETVPEGASVVRSDVEVMDGHMKQVVFSNPSNATYTYVLTPANDYSFSGVYLIHPMNETREIINLN